jgi:hypothetical protein
MPVHIYLQEAENLHRWMQPDLPRFVTAGIAEEILGGMQPRTGALREAQSAWKARRHTKEQAQEEYEALSVAAFAFLEDTIHHVRFAFRRHPGLLARTPNAAELVSDTQRFQAMNDVAVLGREHPALLEATGFDLAGLDQMAALSNGVADALAAAEEARRLGNGAKTLRDRAFTLLKGAVDEIREAARFLFRKDPERLAGYRSEYWRRMSRAADAPAEGQGAFVEYEEDALSDSGDSADSGEGVSSDDSAAA